MRSHRSGCACAASPTSPSGRRERLLGLAHLGALQVADLGREAARASRPITASVRAVGVAVARDDLGGDGLDGEAEALAGERLDARVDVRVGADRAGELADRDAARAPAQPLAVAVELVRPAEQLEPERRRLRVHAVGATHASACRGTRSAAPRPRPSARRRREQQLARLAGLSASAVSTTSDDVSP